MLKNYKELKVWQKSYKLYLEIYRMTAKFPEEERCGLISRIRRFVLPIPSDIAEGIGRKQTLESLTPGILGPSSLIRLEKNLT
ncbi:MAG: four helix bundle protein [Thermodesulfobacteriota bacterium]|nr:four helix bundle protein [Thermodesulfobacteriota bacterium]